MTVVSLVDFDVYDYPEDQEVTLGTYGGSIRSNFISINYIKTFCLFIRPGNYRSISFKTVNGKKTAGQLIPAASGSQYLSETKITLDSIDTNAKTDYDSNMLIGDSIIYGFRINVLFPNYEPHILSTVELSIGDEPDSTGSGRYYQQNIDWTPDKKFPYVELYFEKTGEKSYKRKLYIDKVLVNELSTNSYQSRNVDVGFRARNKQTPKQNVYAGISDIYIAYNDVRDTSKTGLIGPVSVKHVYPESVTAIGNWKTDTGATEVSDIKQTISKRYKHEDSITRKDYITTDEFGGKLSVKFKTPQEATDIVAAHYMVAASRPESTSANMNVTVTNGTEVMLDKKVFPIEKIPKVSFLKVHGIENQSGNATITPQEIDNVEVTVSSEPIVVSPF